jgi:hypothetical protein
MRKNIKVFSIDMIRLQFIQNSLPCVEDLVLVYAPLIRGNWDCQITTNLQYSNWKGSTFSLYTLQNAGKKQRIYSCVITFPILLNIFTYWERVFSDICKLKLTSIPIPTISIRKIALYRKSWLYTQALFTQNVTGNEVAAVRVISKRGKSLGTRYFTCKRRSCIEATLGLRWDETLNSCSVESLRGNFHNNNFLVNRGIA